MTLQKIDRPQKPGLGKRIFIALLIAVLGIAIGLFVWTATVALSESRAANIEQSKQKTSTQLQCEGVGATVSKIANNYGNMCVLPDGTIVDPEVRAEHVKNAENQPSGVTP